MLKFRLGLLALLIFGLVLGCSSQRTKSSLSGKVTYKGQPLKGGNMTFNTEKGIYSSEISKDGDYEVFDIPAGNVTVTIDTESINPNKKVQSYGGKGDKMYEERMAAEKKAGVAAGEKGMSKEEMTERYVKIPAKYADEKTSEIKFTLEPGKQKKDFELTD